MALVNGLTIWISDVRPYEIRPRIKANRAIVCLGRAHYTVNYYEFNTQWETAGWRRKAWNNTPSGVADVIF